MKRTIAMLSTALVVAVGGGLTLAGAGAATVPEIDPSAATVQLGPGHLKIIQCTGQQTIGGVETPEPYVTLEGSWKGASTDGNPGGTPYNLNGNFLINKAVWTINLNTGQGVLKGTAELVNSSIVFEGPMVLITQEVDGAQGPMNARGFIQGKTYTGTTPNGGDYWLNVEFQFSPGTYSATGEWGGSMSFPDYSAYDNNKIC